jgi:phosphoserine phosphatase
MADHLGIAHVEAVPLYFNEDGSYKGYGEDYPTTRNLGKNEVIREWKQAMLPERVVMIGDGVSDLETKLDVDTFIGFGGIVARSKVKSECDHWLTDINDHSILSMITGESSQQEEG